MSGRNGALLQSWVLGLGFRVLGLRFYGLTGVGVLVIRVFALSAGFGFWGPRV